MGLDDSQVDKPTSVENLNPLPTPIMELIAGYDFYSLSNRPLTPTILAEMARALPLTGFRIYKYLRHLNEYKTVTVFRTCLYGLHSRANSHMCEEFSHMKIPARHEAKVYNW